MNLVSQVNELVLVHLWKEVPILRNYRRNEFGYFGFDTWTKSTIYVGSSK